MPKNNPAAKNKMVTPKVKGSWWNRDMSMLTTLVPLKFLPIDWIDVPGRTQVDVSPKIDIESMPAVSPLYDGWTLETYYFFVPYRLYMPTLRINNVQDVGVLDAEKFPLLRFRRHNETAPDGKSYMPLILPGSLMHRLGYPIGEFYSMRTIQDKDFFDAVTSPEYSYEVEMNALPLMAYLDVWLYSQFNKQDKYIPVEHRVLPSYDINGFPNGGASIVTNFVDYDNLKQVIPNVAFGKQALYTQISPVAHYNGASENVFSFGQLRVEKPRVELVPDYPLFDVSEFYFGNVSSFCDVRRKVGKYLSNTGLLPVTYFGDKFTSWFSKEGVQKLSEYTLTGNESLLELRRNNSDMIIDMLAMVSGNDYRSYLKFVYGTELDLCDHPIMVGKDVVKFGFMDVLNQSANVDTSGDVTDVNQALAYTASKARSKNNNVRDINFKTRENGLFMVFASLRPTVRYFQGQDAFMYKREFSELWHPQYSSLGFQNTQFGELYTTFMGTLTSSSALPYPVPAVGNPDEIAMEGYVPLGWEYQVGTRKLGGAMVMERYRTWSSARDFTLDDSYVTTDEQTDGFQMWLRFCNSSYGNRSNFDFNFVDTSDEAQNFIMNFSAKVRCYQPMSKVLVKPSI